MCLHLRGARFQTGAATQCRVKSQVSFDVSSDNSTPEGFIRFHRPSFPTSLPTWLLITEASWLVCNPWWRHQMESFSALLALCAGNSPVTGEFLHKGQRYGALVFSLIYAWINGWVNNRVASGLRRHHAHYSVIVMPSYTLGISLL